MGALNQQRASTGRVARRAILLWSVARRFVGAAAFLSVGCHQAPLLRYPSADAVLERLAAQSSCSRAVTGDAALELSGPFVNVKGQLLYKAEAPDKLRFDLYSPLGLTLNALTSDGERFSLYDFPNKRFVYGAASTCNLATFTRISIPPFALVELLRGRPPVLAHDPGGVRFRWAQPWFSEGHYVISLQGEFGASEKLWIDVPQQDRDLPLEQQRLRLSRVRVEQKGHLLYEVELSDYAQRQRAPLTLTAEEIEMGIPPAEPTGPECSSELPGRLSFNVGKGGYRLALISREAFHNPAKVPTAYTQEIPDGVTVSLSSCDAPPPPQ